jgi:hypothetical protein
MLSQGVCVPVCVPSSGGRDDNNACQGDRQDLNVKGQMNLDGGGHEFAQLRPSRLNAGGHEFAHLTWRGAGLRLQGAVTSGPATASGDDDVGVPASVVGRRGSRMRGLAIESSLNLSGRGQWRGMTCRPTD